MSDTTGWKREDGEYFKVINGHTCTIYKRTAGFFPGGWVVCVGNILVTPKYTEPRRLADAKRAAHRHAEEKP
jgi:hypothetical protein